MFRGEVVSEFSDGESSSAGRDVLVVAIQRTVLLVAILVLWQVASSTIIDQFWVSNDLFLRILFPFLWTKYLLRGEVLKHCIPNLQKHWTQFLLDILREVLSQVNE